MKPLVLPEYGRNIQNMLEHCLTIDDRDERTRCATSIIDAMSILFPSQGDQKAYRRTLWDHLAIMSDFKLDVDLPFELVRPEEFALTPEPVALGSGHARRRIYGCHLELMLSEAAKMPAGDERDALVYMLADHMKKTLAASSPESADDERVFNDIYEMTDGAVRLDPTNVKLHEFQIIAPPNKKKKKK